MRDREEVQHRETDLTSNPEILRKQHRPRRRPFETLSERYVAHYTVNSPREARALSRQGSWDVLQYVRASGGRGVSPGEASRILNIPSSDVYSIIKELSRLGYVFPIPKEKMPRGERRKKYVYDGFTWKRYQIDERLNQALEQGSLLKDFAYDLSRTLFSGLTRIHDDLTKNSSQLLPSKEPAQFCPKCGLNHEAIELFHAITLAALVMIEADHMEEFLSQLGYLH